MKLRALILIASSLHLCLNTFAQQITFSGRDVPLEKVLETVKQQTGYVFFLNKSILQDSKPVTVQADKQPLESFLDQVFNNQPLEYNIKSRNIIISRKPVATPSALKTAQEPVTGVVRNAAGEPIPGISIGIKGTGSGVMTDGDGKYAISAEPGAVLVFSGVGLETKEIKLGAGRSVNITMEVKVGKLDAVVVTGIFNRKQSSFTGAATTITAKELQQFGNRNIITSLRNIDPSFNIVESNLFGSDPNRLPEIQIRGNSSIPNVDQLQEQTRVDLNTPLIILDGFQSTLQKLLDINENEVESITILKDASATAIYGSRGSNGVVVITTKAPREGRLQVSYRGDLNIEVSDLSAYNMLDAREKLELERRAGYYNHTSNVTLDLTRKKYYNYLLNEINSGVNTDWLSIPLRTGVGQRHNIRLEGGDKRFRYSASAQLNDIKGVMIGSGRKTINGNITLSYTYQNLRFRNNLQVADVKSVNSPYGTFSDYARMNPYWRTRDDNGHVLKLLGVSAGDESGNYWGANPPVNPQFNANLSSFDKSATSEIINNTSVEWNILPDLLLRGQLGISKGNTQTDRFRSAEHTAFATYTDADIFRKGDYNYGITNAFNYDASLNLSYNRTFNGNHTLFAGADYNIRQTESSMTGFLAEGFTNPNLNFIATALQYAQDGKPTGTESLTRSVGFTGNLSYIFDNRYFADASFRMDGSSQFGSSRRFAPFWSAGLGWNLHEEAFLQGSKHINRLKIRGSAGITGSQNFNAYQALSTYRYYTDDRYFNWNGAYLMGLGNPDLRWQQAMKYNAGVDAELFDRRIRITADVYTQTTRDLVSSVTLAPTNGFSSYVDNIGRMRNRGYEVKATGFIISKPQQRFTWSMTAAFFHNQNTVLETSRALKEAQLAIRNQANLPGVMYVEGYSSNTIWVVPSMGIDPSTGKELFVGADGKPTYIWDANNVAAAGIADPTIQGSLSSMVRYGPLSFNISFGGRFGGQLYNQTLVDKVETGSYRYNVDQRVYDNRWMQPGDRAAFKGLTETSPTYKTSRFVQDENMINCQNINLQYEVKSDWLRRSLGVSYLMLTANTADVFYISTVRQERGTSYPFSRHFSFNVNATF